MQSNDVFASNTLSCCVFNGAECESVVHVLWECSAYSSSRASFLLKFEELLGDRYADFEALREDVLRIRE